MNSSRKLHEMTPTAKQAKKPWVGHHQRRRFWALFMWLCSAGMQTILIVSIRSILLRWTVWKTSISRKRGNRTSSFTPVCKFLCIIYLGLFFPLNLIDFSARSAQATLAVLTLPRMSTMFSSSLFGVPEERQAACIQPGLRFYLVPTYNQGFVKCQSMSHVLMAGKFPAVVELSVRGGGRAREGSQTNNEFFSPC